MSAIIAVLSKKGENADEIAFTMLNALAFGKAGAFGMASSSTVTIKRNLEELCKEKIDSPVIVGSTSNGVLKKDRLQPLQVENGSLVFAGRIYNRSFRKPDVEAAAEELKEPYVTSANIFVRKTRGDFSFALAESERIVAGRDLMGICPLYYGENADWTALASERRVLWEIGVEKTCSFPTGDTAILDRNGFRFKSAIRFTYSNPKQTTMKAAVKRLQLLLEKSTRERTAGLDEVAVAFSGGLDSTIIAFLIKKNTQANVQLIHVSLENRPETEHAEAVAEELRLPIRVCRHEEKDVEKVLPKVLWLIEDPDPIQTGIGIPVCWVAEQTAEMNIRVLLAGQTADELFGGYKRYEECYTSSGPEKTREMMFNDIVNIHETNFERDVKIFSFHNVELRLPFAALDIAGFALDLPIRFKLDPARSTLRKLVLREMAREIGVPLIAVERPKKAIQYATGVNEILKKLAKERSMSLREYLQNAFNATFAKEGFARQEQP